MPRISNRQILLLNKKLLSIRKEITAVALLSSKMTKQLAQLKKTSKFAA